MALTVTEIIRAIVPYIGLVVNPDGSYRIGVEDVNSDEILAAILASGVDLAALEIINTAIQAATEASAVDLAAIEVINTAIQGAIEAQGEGVYTTPTHTWPVIGAATTVALAANANRLYAAFINDGTEPIYLYLGAAAVMNRGIRLNASGGSYEMNREIGNLYVGAVNGICASGGMVCLVTEGV